MEEQQQCHTCLRSLGRASLAGGRFQLCVVHRLNFSLKFLHHGCEGMGIYSILAQSDTDAQGGRIEIRVQQLGDLI